MAGRERGGRDGVVDVELSYAKDSRKGESSGLMHVDVCKTVSAAEVSNLGSRVGQFEVEPAVTRSDATKHGGAVSKGTSSRVRRGESSGVK